MKFLVEMKDDELGIPISENDMVVALAFEFGLPRIVSVKYAVQQGVQADELKPCAECGALGYNHRPSCSKYGTYVVSTRR